MLKLTFFVPKDSCEKVKEALFAVGAGKIGHYENCCFETEGIGQFKAMKGAHPSIGQVDILEKILEVRVEMVLNDIILNDVIRELKKHHPYETPAFDVVKCLDV